MNKKNKIDRNFISDIDKKLAEFDESHKLSPSQQAEAAKYRDLNHLRDEPVLKKPSDDESEIWD